VAYHATTVTSITVNSSQHNTRMRLRSALGLGIAIVLLQLLVPAVWGSFEHLMLTFFSTAEEMLASASLAPSIPGIAP